ncbi:amidohydrolase/deacetylase family metallohydrolase, partial [Serratia marcescens]
MYDLVIRGARLADDTLIDLAVKDGKIASVGRLAADVSAVRQLDLAGNCRLSAGWIDAHVHCYPDSPIYHDEPDRVGVASGVTSVVDAGSTGADDIDAFYQLTRSAKTNVFAFLNISRIGLLRQNELAELTDIDKHEAGQAIANHPGFIIGIKARMSSSVVGKNGTRPLVLAKEIQRENRQLPLMVHIGNNPPNLDEIADLLTRGDIITHCYNGKPNRILTPAGTLRESIQRALRRGVLLDAG